MSANEGLLINRMSRRDFLAAASALSTLVLAPPRLATAEPLPEVKQIRIGHLPAICLTPQYLAEELLYSEGFEWVEYVDDPLTGPGVMGAVDFVMNDGPSTLYGLDRGLAAVALAGIHAGCYELFGNERVHAIRDLKGTRVAIDAFGGVAHVFIASIVSYVGMDPRKDIDWRVAGSWAAAMRFFVDGKADAFLAGPPQPQDLRSQKVGHVIINTVQDRPWSQYFCCFLLARREFARKYPAATKRVVRALLKATDICAQEPERAARYLVAKGYEKRYELALEVLKQLPYRRWRDDDPETTLRFHALRLHDGGLITGNPNRLIAAGSDWRVLNELKNELKA
jgi:NitT/TauT family transport system substrate-binding protein